MPIVTQPCCHSSLLSIQVFHLYIPYFVSSELVIFLLLLKCHLCLSLSPVLSHLVFIPLVTVTHTVTPPPYVQVTYIQPIVSTSSVGAKDAAFPHIVSVNGIIGTRWSRRHILPIVYHLGPTYLFEETVSSEGIQHIARLGPTYMGCFQAPVIKDYVSVLCSSGGVLYVRIVRCAAIY